MDTEKPAFEVRNPKTGQRWRVYVNGRIEGFEPYVVVINRIPLLMSQAAAEALHHDRVD